MLKDIRISIHHKFLSFFFSFFTVILVAQVRVRCVRLELVGVGLDAVHELVVFDALLLQC